MIEFILRFGSVVSGLGELLGFKFIEGNHYSQTYLGQWTRRVLLHHNAGHYKERDLDLTTLVMLRKHLEEIQAHDPNLFAGFKRELRKCMEADNYFGLRMEINTAASLIRKGANFLKRESPDFAVTLPNGKAFVECGSAHFTKPKGYNVAAKLAANILGKCQKPYANPATARFMDTTNIFSADPRAYEDHLEHLKDHVRSCLPSDKYGSVLLFTYLQNADTNRFESAYVRADGDAIDPVLSSFLDAFYPTGFHSVDRYVFPTHG